MPSWFGLDYHDTPFVAGLVLLVTVVPAVAYLYYLLLPPPKK